MGFGVWGLGAWDVGFGFGAVRFQVWGVGFKFSVLGQFRVWGILGFGAEVELL